MATHTVTVTQEDIDKGIIGAPSSCPVARAIERAIGQEVVTTASRWIEKDRETVDWYEWHEHLSVVRQFIINYDCDNEVSPFTFVIDR